MSAYNADLALKEFLGPRADNYSAKSQMYHDIMTKGYVSMNQLDTDNDGSSTLNTMDAFFLASGIKTDMVTNSLKTKYTINKQLKR